MNRFIEGTDRSQATLFPDRLEDWIDEDNLVRVIDGFVDALDLNGLGFIRATAVVYVRSLSSCAVGSGFIRRPAPAQPGLYQRSSVVFISSISRDRL